MRRLVSVFCTLMLLGSPAARAMQITGFSPAAHNRFASGYPAAPVPNSDPAFVGAPHDWSGVGWADSLPTKSFGFLSPRHYLVARHYGGDSTLRILGADAQLHSRTQQSVTPTNLGMIFTGQTVGDLSLGTLTAPFPLSALPTRYAILDRNASSFTNNPANYNGLNLLIYGRGPDSASSTRIAPTPLNSASVSGDDHRFTTPRTELQLETGDSGSPAFIPWTNPDNSTELTLIGNHAAVNDTLNFHNFIATAEVISALNTLMRPDGRALRIVGNPQYTWVGSLSTELHRNAAWGIGRNLFFTGAASDQFVLFDSTTAASTEVNVTTDFFLRGLYFRGPDPFAVSGSSILTLGRGGITLYGTTPHTVTAPLALGSDQIWHTGTTSLAVQSLTLNEHLLELIGNGTLSIQGPISGSGSLALGGGSLQISADSTYTGPTWVHDGQLTVHSTLTSSSHITLGPAARLTGSGSLPPVQGSGTVQPAGSTLTAQSLDGSQGLSLAFTLATSAPDGNELLRLTAPAPFTAPLSAASTLSIYLLNETLTPGQTWQGGLFTDTPADFLPAIANAQLRVYQWDTAEYRLLTPADGEFTLETVPHTLDINGTPVNGQILLVTCLPPAGTYERWAYETFPPETDPALQTPLATPNPLAIPNLVSYAHGWDPLSPDPADRPALISTPTALLLQWWQNPDALDITPLLESSPDLLAWGPSGLTPEFVLTQNGKDLYQAEVPLSPLQFYRVRWEFTPGP